MSLSFSLDDQSKNGVVRGALNLKIIESICEFYPFDTNNGENKSIQIIDITMVNKKEILHNEFVQDLEDYKKMIFKLAHSYSNSYDGTLDLTQEIILQLWKSYTSYNSAFKKSTWIYRIALNVCISQLRKSTNRKKTEAAYTSLQQIFTLNNDIQLEQLNLLKKYIEELNSFDKALILLYLDGQKNDEIAQILGISETNTSTRISRIKDKLKNTHKQTIS